MNHIPLNKEVHTNCGIPFGAVTQPLATQHPEEARLSVVDMGESGPIRCNRCKAYINPHVKFLAHGTKFQCNFCGVENELPRWYHCNLDEFGHRRDKDSRPEIGCGSVEFSVPPAYSVRPPQIPVFVFCIDVSLRSLATGLFETVIQTVRKSLLTLPGQPRTKVGIMTFDNTLHYYTFNPNSEETRMVVVGDVSDPYAPVPEHCWLVDISDGTSKIEAALDLIEQVHGEKKEELDRLKKSEEDKNRTGPMSTADKFNEDVAHAATTKFQDCACGSAIASAYDALKDIGGRIILVQSSLPTTGTGILVGREQGKLYGTDMEREMWTFQPGNPAAMFYKNLAEKCASAQVSVDIFVATSVFTDVATIGCLPALTGGQLRRFLTSPKVDSNKLSAELSHTLNRGSGFEAVMKVRTSQGMHVSEILGNASSRPGAEVDLAIIHEDQAVAFTLDYSGEALKEGENAYLQVAVLYTNMKGARVVRVHNLAVPVTSSLVSIFKHADLETTTCVLKNTACRDILAPKATFSKVRK